MQYLTKRIYPPKKSTHGINLITWQPKEDEFDFTASIWDFGGQEYYHATHRLFLTNNAFYLLLWDKNKNQTAILPTDIYTQKGILENKKLQHFHYEYWLKVIRKQFAPNAEIITVQNKTDISGSEIIAQQTIDNYNIKGQYQISIEETAKGIKKQKRKYTDFEEDLKDYITDFIKSKAPEGEEAGKIQRYIDNIRKAIRNDWNEDYLSFENFTQKAKEVAKNGGDEIDDFSIEVALKYLHDTGILLYYGYEATMQNSILQKYVFIDPNYVTGTIYKILDENFVQKNGGKFDFEHVKNKVNTEKEAELFVALMQSPNFELIFTYDGFYYASQFLPEINTVIDYQKNSLDFAFSLRFPNFFSASFITRFISRYGIQAKNNAFCCTGIILKHDNIDFYISTEIDNEQITVKTTEEGKKHAFVRKIYDIFLEFAYSDKNIEVSLDNKEFAPLSHIERYNLPEYNIERLFKPLTENEEVLIKINYYKSIIMKGKFGNKVQELQEALLAAFHTHSELEQMVRFSIDESIREIVKDGNLKEKTFELIMWAVSEGKIKELILGAKEQNSGNVVLKKINEANYEFTNSEISETQNYRKNTTQIANKIYNINKIEGGAKFE